MRITNPYDNLDFYQSNIITTHFETYERPKIQLNPKNI